MQIWVAVAAIRSATGSSVKPDGRPECGEGFPGNSCCPGVSRPLAYDSWSRGERELKHKGVDCSLGGLMSFPLAPLSGGRTEGLSLLSWGSARRKAIGFKIPKPFCGLGHRTRASPLATVCV